MQRLFLSLLICLGFALPATAHAWWQDDWHYRKQISVDTTAQGAAINQSSGPHRAAGAPAHRQLHL